jgi:flavorubredoxin
MPVVTEVASDLYRISIYVPEGNLQFNHFLVRDEEPLLFHAGLKAMFPLVREAVATLIDPTRLRWIGFSHFESDECGALNQWLELAPDAEPFCSFIGAVVNVSDFALRPPRAMTHGEALTTGKYSYRFCSTAQLPHGWDAGVLFRETDRTLLCSDLFHQNGDVEPSTESDVIDRARQVLVEYQASPFANYMPYTPRTERILHSLADLHGSTFVGDGAQALRDLAVVMRETLGEP